ncbi:hypothetical protein K9M74_03855 [Candidatus Woesearchaeota archaeon]|nr:hypothetical protein [Candidatus Woesearchaeota archaeon]
MELISGVLPALGEIVKAPLGKPSLLWQLAPIFCIWILVEFYFAMHKKERLGWNTALSNGISLFWIVISAMQHIFSEKEAFTWLKFALIFFIASYAMFIIFISFKHTFKSNVTFMFASPTPLFYFSVMVLYFAHDLIPLNLETILGMFLLFIILLIFVVILKKILPEMKEEDDFKHDDKLDMDFDKHDTPLPSSDELQPHMPSFPDNSLNQQMPAIPGGLEQEIGTQSDPFEQKF